MVEGLERVRFPIVPPKVAFFDRKGGFLFSEHWLFQNGTVAFFARIMHHSAIKFVSPAARHEGREAQILSTRKETYEIARRRHPSRWSRGTRNWSAVEKVVLNPQRGKDKARVQESAQGTSFDQAG